VANDKDTYGAGLARTLLYAAGQSGQKNQIVSNQGIDKTAPNFRSYASTLQAKGVDCFLFSGITANGAVQLMKDVHAALPNAKLYGPDGICESGFTNPSKKGAPADVTKNFQCTVATLNLASYPGGQQFLQAYKAKYNDPHPDPYAIYGYEAMKLFIDTIKKLGDKGTDKSAVLDALFATKNRQSVLGTYSFDQNGDTTLTDYGVYKVGSDGDPTFEKTIKAGSS
jgi:branched-chain amino acid transport system substrate-binding protein